MEVRQNYSGFDVVSVILERYRPSVPSVFSLAGLYKLDQAWTFETREIVSQNCQDQKRSVGHYETRRIEFRVVRLALLINTRREKV